MIDTEQEMALALAEAAELEHSLICQYLFAAYSLKTDPILDGLAPPDAAKFGAWRHRVLTIALQEMGHLGTVFNIMGAMGLAPHLGRASFPQPAGRYYAPSIDFSLERFGEPALRRFVALEAPEPPPFGTTFSIVPDPIVFSRVGDLYRQIRTCATTLPDAALLLNASGPEDDQAWSNSVALRPAKTRAEILAALDFIIRQGEGTPSSTLGSHHAIFVTLLAELAAHRAAGGVEPARPVVPNPRTRPSRGVSEGTPIEDGPARDAMGLFNATYGLLLRGLQQYYAFAGETQDQREALRTACYRLMHEGLGPLGAALTRLPVAPGATSTAGPSFEIHGPEGFVSVPRIAWRALLLRLNTLERTARAIAGSTPATAFDSLAEAAALARAELEAVLPT